MHSKNIFWEIKGKDVHFTSFDISQPEGYSACQNFPDCCPFHKSILQHAKNWFKEFPSCCDLHKELAKKSWFNKKDYEGLAEKIVRQVSYTEFLITKAIKKENWYKEITDYISFNMMSFGQPPVGQSRYLNALKHLFKETKDLPEDKKNRLLSFVESHLYPDKSNVVNINLNALHHIIQKWVGILPELDVFKDIKLGLKGRFPINLVVYDIEKNKYSGLSSAKVKTEKELINVLVNLTKAHLRKINTAGLVKQGLIEKAGQVGLMSEIEEHRIRQVALLEEFNEEEGKYLHILKKWLANEVIFFKSKVEPLIKEQSSSKLKTVKRLGKNKESVSSVKFDDGLIITVQKALKEKELLTSKGKYTGSKMQIKALYNVLVKRGYVLGVTGPEEQFAAWFFENFEGTITGRALRNPPGKNQDDEEREFLYLIQGKK